MLEQIRAKNAKLRQRNHELAQERARTIALQAETEDAFMMSIQFLARAAELYDEETGNHILRVNEYSHFLAQAAGMPKAFCDEIRYSAQLHDVGKISVDTAVLKKRGRLNAKERAEMDRHPLYGHDILTQSPRLQMAADIALYHHEKWDGSGYPNGVKGEDIPLSARIVAVADVYDALRSARPYKQAFDHDEAVRIMLHGGGRIQAHGHFDPMLLDIVARQHRELAAIYDRLRD
jgi:HD-GYP domain-containing protein (c-di-GMP phosphodiesterase class II)